MRFTWSLFVDLRARKHERDQGQGIGDREPSPQSRRAFRIWDLGRRQHLAVPEFNVMRRMLLRNISGRSNARTSSPGPITGRDFKLDHHLSLCLESRMRKLAAPALRMVRSIVISFPMF